MPDGYIAASVLGAPLWERWCNLVERPDLLHDGRFKDDISRGDHRDELCGIMDAWCAARSVDEALTALAELKVPAAPVYTPQQVLEASTSPPSATSSPPTTRAASTAPPRWRSSR